MKQFIINSINCLWQKIKSDVIWILRNLNKILEITIPLTLLWILLGCSTSKTTGVYPEHEPVLSISKERDTLYLNRIQYDSVFVNNYHLVDRGGDTIIIQDAKVEYRYRLLRDTIKVHQIDSIPVIKEVEVTKEVKYVPWYDKALAWIGGITLVLLVAYIVFRIIKFYLTLK